MTALALVFLFAYSWEVLARTHIVLCETVINIIWMAFIVDYVVSILLAKDKKAWFKENLLMLVSIALPIFRPLRLLRLVAVLTCSTVPVAWRCVDVSHCTHAAA